ncbi:MAG: molecular chaperone HtpG [Gammaproteobacteria bacterium]|nr:molecular chaperone HtpG [Gammaproteobacteria bacterium]
MTVEGHKETLEFQTEVRQLLHLMIHSLYSNKEIFLRELVSNASDACDKLRFEALTDDALFEDDSELRIELEFDKDARTITIRDNGIGMDRQEVIDNIGTIASSGTRKFMENLSGDQKKDAQLIGQFGVGFYSSFIVADQVVVTTRRAGMGAEHAVRWTSKGEGAFDLETVEKATRGTEVVLHLKADEDEFLDDWRLRNVIRKYSEHISLPIKMLSEREEGEGDDKATVIEWETVNSASALWTRPKSEISDEDYQAFYKHVSHDWDDALAWSHNRVEGNQSYTSLLYLPKRAPFDLWDRERRTGIKLYVRRVFIMDDAEHLMPQYLRFVKGVIDSDDLPLNVSREILQHNRLIDVMRGASVKKVLGMLETMVKEQPEQYAEFWTQFGKVIKEGPGEDHANKDRIAKLLRFASTHDGSKEQKVSLEDYVARMKEGQAKIYYVVADSHAAAANSPHLEVFRKKGIEVLLLSDRVDEWLVAHLNEFDGKPLQSVAKGDLDLGGLDDAQDKEQAEKAAEENKDFLTRVGEVLSDKAQEVRLSHRLTESPSCIVLNDFDMAMHMQRLMKEAGHDIPSSKPTLELNPDHALVRKLKGIDGDEDFKDLAEVLFDQAMLAEGGQLDDPAGFVRRMNKLLAN